MLKPLFWQSLTQRRQELRQFLCWRLLFWPFVWHAEIAGATNFKALVFLQRALSTGFAMSSKSKFLFSISMILFTLMQGCDPEGRKDCVWVLEAEESLIGTAKEGLIPVCARNRKTMKQDCRLQTTLAFAKEVQGRHFRYVDLRVKSVGLPREILDIQFCDRKGN